MLRRILLALAVSALAFVAPVPAVAGGGCHEEPTSGTGDAVKMVGACFTPTTLEVEPGTTVSFVNHDPIPHNVSAAGWGRLEDLSEGDSFTATFAEAGIYPYACTYHPGMTGAIVVGGRAAPTKTGEGDVTALGAAGAAGSVHPLPAASASSGSGGPWSELAAGAIGLAAGLALGWAVRRRRAATAA